MLDASAGEETAPAICMNAQRSPCWPGRAAYLGGLSRSALALPRVAHRELALPVLKLCTKPLLQHAYHVRGACSHDIHLKHGSDACRLHDAWHDWS